MLNLRPEDKLATYGGDVKSINGFMMSPEFMQSVSTNKYQGSDFSVDPQQQKNLTEREGTH